MKKFARRFVKKLKRQFKSEGSAMAVRAEYQKIDDEAKREEGKYSNHSEITKRWK